MNDNCPVSVLVVPGTPADFLINRQQCTSSIYIGNTRPRTAPAGYLREDLITGDMVVPLFNLDRFFAEFFCGSPASENLLALLRPWDSFPASVQAGLVSRGITEGTPVGFRVSSATYMADLPLQAIKRWPGILAPFLESRGLIAASISPEGGMRLFVDLDILFGHHILFHKPLEERTCAP